ncbi:MAG: diaminopimelate decarboxylase [Chloroflexota bacterium]
MNKFAKHVWPLSAAVVENQLQIDTVPVNDLAERYGTPLYIFDEATIRDACQQYKSAFATYPGWVEFSYASKALLNTAVAKLLLEEGFGFDVVSLGEMQLAMHAGAKPEQLHLHGNAKPRFELEEALKAGIGRIAVDNLDEARTLAELCAELDTPASIILRIEPAVAASTHKAIQTGQKGSKFGMSLELVDSFVEIVDESPHLELVGLHFHLGSQLFDLSDYQKALGVVLDLMVDLWDDHQIEITEISPGGGLAAAYSATDQIPNPAELADTIVDFIVTGCNQRRLSIPTLILEPGRSIISRAGVAVYEVIGSKPIEDAPAGSAQKYLHVDGGMGDNLRPALYGAKYTAVSASEVEANQTEMVHISGRFCESGDILLKNAEVAPSAVGDVIAFASAGAYTLSIANNYNLVPRPLVLMMDGGQERIIQRRETFEDLIRRDVE